jgi:hypothetical protein
MGIERIKNRLLLPGMVDAHGWSEVAVVYFRAGYAPEDMMDAGPYQMSYHGYATCRLQKGSASLGGTWCS